jgi:hypothetical protein
MRTGEPFVRASVQVQPLNSSFGGSDFAYLQVFAGATKDSSQYAFENETVFDASGNLVKAAPANGATPEAESGMLIAYSNQTSVFSQDSVAIRFNSTDIYDLEHWIHDGPFDGLSWVGLGFGVQTTKPGELSAPAYAEVYPIQHLDFRLLSDTAKYIVSDPRNVAVSPPVGFGFIASGLALESMLNPSNQTLRELATGLWNFYYHRYEGTQPTTAYARATNVFALAGFQLYGGNSTVENFTREFVGGYQGSSIEESGWAAAALRLLCSYTNSSSDCALYRSVIISFQVGGSHFLSIANETPPPNSTFQFAEAASGLLMGKMPYNSSAVLWAMSAVFQSNVSGVLRIKPYGGDMANTETIPAYALAMWLFQNEMKNATGYWIESLHNLNITSIGYSDGKLRVNVVGRNGLVSIGSPSGTITRIGINGSETFSLGNSPASETFLLVGAVLIAAVAVVVVVFAFRRREKA